MSRNIFNLETTTGRVSFYADGELSVAQHDYYGEANSTEASLTPAEAVNLASALLQYATQNGASREQAD